MVNEFTGEVDVRVAVMKTGILAVKLGPLTRFIASDLAAKVGAVGLGEAGVAHDLVNSEPTFGLDRAWNGEEEAVHCRS